MKKIINGFQIDIDTGFWSDYLYGKELQKITLSNIHDKIEYGKEINSIIESYRSCFDNLHPIMQTIESDLKYCLMGELIGKPYCVHNRGLYIKLKNSQIAFRGNFWSIRNSDKKGITWKDIKTNQQSEAYQIYLKEGKENWIKLAFPNLYNAVDGNEDKLLNELNTILNFIDVDQIELNFNEIIDFDLNIKYGILNSLVKAEPVKGTKCLNIDLETNKALLTHSYNKIYKYTVFKQNLIELEKGIKDYGKLEQVSGLFNDIFDVYNKEEGCKDIKGIKINGTVYYECNGDIYQSRNNKSEKIIQKGKLYGVKVTNPLVYHDRMLEQGIIKRTVYLLKDDFLDIASIQFLRKEEM